MIKNSSNVFNYTQRFVRLKSVRFYPTKERIGNLKIVAWIEKWGKIIHT